MSRESSPSRGLNAAVAAVLSGERVAAGMTYDDLADVSGISRRTLMRYLSAKDRHIDIDTLDTLAVVFRTTPVQILSAAAERLNRPGVTERDEAAEAMREAMAQRQASEPRDIPGQSERKA